MVVTEQDGFRPKISIVAAVAANGVIGVDNRLPWRLPADMRRFRELTLGKPVIMGRRTYESIGRPLAKRTNIVLTRNLNFEADGCIVVHSAEAAIAAAGDARELMVIGAFETWLPLTDRLYLTQIAAEFEGDTFSRRSIRLNGRSFRPKRFPRCDQSLSVPFRYTGQNS